VGKYHVTLSQCHNWCDGWSQMVMSQVTVCHMTRVTWGPWESKHITMVVKCISNREMSKNSIEFSLLNSEQRDSWLNSGCQTLDANKIVLLIRSLYFLPTTVYNTMSYIVHQVALLPSYNSKTIVSSLCSLPISILFQFIWIFPEFICIFEWKERKYWPMLVKHWLSIG